MLPAHPERLVHVVTALRASRLQPLRDRLEALDLEPDVVDAAPVLAALDSSHRVILEVEDGQVEIAVRQVIAARPRAIDPGDLLHAEDVDVELGGLVDVLGRKGDVLDLWHGVSPVAVVGSLGLGPYSSPLPRIRRDNCAAGSSPLASRSSRTPPRPFAEIR